MKRLGMNFDPSPVKGLKSYLEMTAAGSAPKNMMPRWWMAANYEPLAKDPEGLAWELRGQGVKCMAEEDFITSSGQAQGTGKANPVAQKWADTMTSKFDELSDNCAIFRELRNCMDLSVVASLIEKENMADKADCRLTLLMDAKQLPIAEYNVPKQVDSKARFVKRSRDNVDQRLGRRAIPALVDHSKPEGRRQHFGSRAAKRSSRQRNRPPGGGTDRRHPPQ